MPTPNAEAQEKPARQWRLLPGGPLAPLKYLGITIGAIFLAEAAVMLLIPTLPPIPYSVVTLLDSSLLVLLVFPILYATSFRPLLAQITERKRVEEELRLSRDDLELRVEGRTREVEQANEALRAALDGTRQRQAEVAALLDGARAVLENHEFATAARSLFRSCRELVGARAGYLSLLGRDGTTNDLVFLDTGGLPCSVDQSLPMPIRGLVGEVLRTGKAEFDNLASTPAWSGSVPGGHVVLENVLFAPLALDGVTAGVLGLANKPGGFSDNDARLATAFAELAAVALLNSRTERELREAHDALEARVLERTEELARANDELRGEIVDRERAEIALRESEDRYRTFLQNFQGIAFRSTLGVAPVFFHGAVQSITGYSEAELLAGTPRWQEIIHPDDRAEALKTMEQTRSEPKFSAEREYRIIRRDGRVRWLREYIQNSCDPTGTPTLAQGALYDITEQKENEGHRAATLTLLELFAQKGSRKEYLDAVVELVREWTGVRTVGIRLHDDEGGAPYEALVGFDDGASDAESGGPEVGLGRPCTRATLRTPDPADLPSLTVGGSFHCTDTAGFVDSAAPGEATGCRDECVNAGFASVAVIPIRYRGRVLGAIHLADDRPAGVSTAGLTFIESTVALVGEAVQRFNLEEELRRFASEQSVLYAVATAASSFLDVKGLLETVLDVVLPALDTDAGWVSMAGTTSDDPPCIAAAHGIPPDLLAAASELLNESCPSCGSLLCSGAIAHEPTAAGTCPRLTAEVLGESGLHSHVATALSSGGDLFGVLNVAWREPHEFSPAEHTLLRAVGNLVGVALANARLFETARSRARHLATLNEIGQAISSSLDLDEILASLLEEVREVTGAQAGFVALKDQTTGDLVYRHVAGESEGDLQARSIDPGEGISGYLAVRRNPGDTVIGDPSGAGAKLAPGPDPPPPGWSRRSWCARRPSGSSSCATSSAAPSPRPTRSCSSPRPRPRPSRFRTPGFSTRSAPTVVGSRCCRASSSRSRRTSVSPSPASSTTTPDRRWPP